MYVASLSCQVARRSEEDPTFFAPLYRSVDTSNVAVMGFSAGGALAVYAAEESQRVWPGRVKAVVSRCGTHSVTSGKRDPRVIRLP